MWDDTPFTRDELETLVDEARNGYLITGAPIAQNVLDALTELARAFPDPTPELVKAVFTAFDSPTSDII